MKDDLPLPRAALAAALAAAWRASAAACSRAAMAAARASCRFSLAAWQSLVLDKFVVVLLIEIAPVFDRGR